MVLFPLRSHAQSDGKIMQIRKVRATELLKGKNETARSLQMNQAVKCQEMTTSYIQNHQPHISEGSFSDNPQVTNKK